MRRLKAGGVGEVAAYRGGSTEALRGYGTSLSTRLPRYATERNEPTPYMTSELSAHLHFGQISPLTIALAVLGQPTRPPECRRRLSRGTDRPPRAGDQLRRAQPRLRRACRLPRLGVDDAGQARRRSAAVPLHARASSRPPRRTTRSGTRRRRRWCSPAGCTITCECTGPRRSSNGRPTPRRRSGSPWTSTTATRWMAATPTATPAIAWAIGGKHDRPWPERPIFGTVRFMSYESTRQKFDSAGYIARVAVAREVSRGRRSSGQRRVDDDVRRRSGWRSRRCIPCSRARSGARGRSRGRAWSR